MLESVHLVNFRCFRDVTVRLGPLTALVGPNASGKTALLQALSRPQTMKEADVRMRTAKHAAEIEWKGDGQTSRWVAKVGGGRSGGVHYQSRYLHLDVRQMRQPIEVQPAHALTEAGGNLANVIATLPRRVQENLARQLASLVPVIQDFTLRPHSSGHHKLVFQDRWSSELWYEPDQVSDGTMLTLGLLTVQHESARVDLIAIEEPEHSLHPYLMGELVSVFRHLASSESGPRPIQIVLATHSAELLEHLQPDEVRFLSRNEDGSVNVEEAATDNENWRRAYAAHQQSLGSMWLSGGLGGVPGG
jgi:predicted ATPase